MASFLLELYSEEIKYEFFNSILKNTKKVLNETFFDLGLVKDKRDSNFELYTTSCRIIIYSNKIKDNIKISHREICGPKLDATDEEINGFLSAYNLNSVEELSKNNTNYILVQKNLEINSKDILCLRNFIMYNDKLDHSKALRNIVDLCCEKYLLKYFKEKNG